MISAVEGRRAEVAALCRRHGVERLDLFGSAAGEDFDPEGSDLDFVVSFERREPPDLFGRYFGLVEDLEALFGRKVDLVMEGALKKTAALRQTSRRVGYRCMGPEERVLKALEDIQDCASFVVEAAEGKDLSDYRRDRLFRQAIERNMEIIGEAIGRIARLDPDTASRVSEHRQIVAFRNRLIHGYDVLDDDLVWSTVKTEVPVLLSEVERLLEERES